MERSSRTFSTVLFFIMVALTPFWGGCAAPAATYEPHPGETRQDQASPVFEEEEFDLEAEFEETSTESPFDPLSGYNRVMTQVNDRLYFWLLKPVARGYRAVFPEDIRIAVGNFFNNLLTPVNVVNNLLQLKPKRAGIELSRFVINTTAGVLGFGDPAADSLDLQAYPEDFGQTLGHYGVGSGFHIVLPLLGPSNLRDTVGLIPDYYLDPISYVEGTEEMVAVRTYKLVNHTSLHIGEYEDLKADAVDLYTFLRDIYEQRRVRQIKE